jgi:hypothetical protein
MIADQARLLTNAPRSRYCRLFELANEPRPKGGAPMWRADLAPFQAWLTAAAAFVKGLAPAQLLASGQEGDTQRLSLGQAALLTQNATGIDVITVHVWPMNFQWLDPSSAGSGAYALAAARAYLAASVAEAAALGKPALVEEFGWPRDQGSISPAAPTAGRDEMYAMVFNMLLASAESQGALAGASFWGYAGAGRPEFYATAVPATAREICANVASQSPTTAVAAAAAPPARNLAGGPVDWAACFFDEGARPEACPVWSWWLPQAAWPNATTRGQTVLVHDPPHETQGWYSVYDKDASTLAVVATAARRLLQLQGCASIAVQSTRAAERVDALAAGGVYGAMTCVSALGPPADAGAAPPRSRACATAVSASAAAPAPAGSSAHAALCSASRSDAFWAHLRVRPAAAPTPAAASDVDVAEEAGVLRTKFAPPGI